MRRLLDQHNLAAEEIHGSDKGGRILKEDVEAFLHQCEQTPPNREESTPSYSIPAPESSLNPSRLIRREPMSRLRTRIAERLLQAQQQTAMLTTFNEVDMQTIIDLRNQYREAFEKKHGVRLGFMSFFVLTAIAALR